MSKIEWTHRRGTKSEVWNMIRGCSLESAGCSNCYAMHMAHRFSQLGGPFEGLTKKTNSGVKWTGEIRLMPEMLTIPLKWKSPRTCFVNSMTDLFHPDVPFDFIDNVFAVMDCCPQHTFIILTKRAERMYDYFQEKREWRVGQLKYAYSEDRDLSCWPLKNVWMLVSAEDQKTYDDRVYHLMRIPAAVRGVSIEPQIGPINMFSRFESNEYNNFWILNGGESGQHARPCHPEWLRKIRNQCKYAGIPYFLKQIGAWEPIDIHRLDQAMSRVGWFDEDQKFISATDWRSLPTTIGHIPSDKRLPMTMVGKNKAGNYLDGVQHLEFPA